MNVGRICRCGSIVMPTESHSCDAMAVAAAADNKRRHRKQREHGRDTRRWRRLSAERREFAGGVCELRLPGCTGTATAAHLDPDLEGRHELASLDDVRAACARCHGVADGPRAQGGVATKATKRARPAPGISRILASQPIVRSDNTEADGTPRGAAAGCRKRRTPASELIEATA